MSNPNRDWMQTITKDVLAIFQLNRDIDTLPAPVWKWASMEGQQFLAL